MPRFDDSFLADISDRVPISQLIGQRVSWDRKKTNASRGDYWACCPFHGEKSPSFHCEDKKGRYHCFGCGVSGSHFRFLMEMDGIEFPRAVEIVADMAGMRLPDSKPLTDAEKAEYARRAREREAAAAKQQREREKDDARRTKGAGAIWKETLPLAGSLGEVYFNWRGLEDPKDENIRFHPGLEYPKQYGDAPGLHPVVVARVQAVSGQGSGIWRIYLQPDGRGKLAGVDMAKLGLGPTAGGAVRLGGLSKNIGLAEGVETSRAVTALGHTMPIWAGLSTSGIIGFVFPPGVETVTVFPDRDAGKIRTREDGRIKFPPGLKAYDGFLANNPGRDIRIAPGPDRNDYLEMYQRLKGHPIR